MSTSSINTNTQDENYECRFVLNNKSNCARRQAIKYDGLCKYHFDKLSEREQEETLIKGNKRLRAKTLARETAKLEAKAKTTVKIESESAELEEFNYAKAQWEEERLTIQEATKKVLEAHQKLEQLTKSQAKDIEELRAQLAMAKELSKVQQQNIDSHLKISEIIKKEVKRANQRNA